MDGERFDGVARALAGGASRRRVLGALLGAGGGLLAGTAAAQPVTCRATADCPAGLDCVCPFSPDHCTCACVGGGRCAGCCSENRRACLTGRDAASCGTEGEPCRRCAPGETCGAAPGSGGTCAGVRAPGPHPSGPGPHPRGAARDHDR